MNCEQANKMNIAGFLSSLGKSPEKASGNGFLYCSPFRNEKTASFKVDQVKNVWFDFGTGTGGRLVDLVCKMYNVGVPGALLILSGSDTSTQSFSFDKQEETNSSIVIKHVQKLQNRALIQYLNSRGIPLNIAEKYLHEVYYNTYQKQIKSFFAIGFKNDAGGYELRNGFKNAKYPEGWKGSTTPKTITTIPGHPEIINVFEGFTDFLSSLVFFKRTHPVNTTIILNSVTNLKYAENVLSLADKVISYLDNDKAGKETYIKLKNINPDTINRSEQIYPEHKDFNEFLIKTVTP